MMFCRGPVNLLREYGNADILIDQYSTGPSGIYDPGTGADAPYDPLEPPDPKTDYTTSETRVSAVMSIDGDGVGTGSILGGGTSFAVYPGNTVQQPDPTIEANLDALYGTGSTPAFRNHSLIVHSAFSLSRWGGTVPNITAVWEHQTLSTLDLIYGAMCERVNVLAANSDYDFSGLSTIESRGMLIAGRPYAPAEVIDSEEIRLAYNYFVTEVNGQLQGFIEGTEPSVTIADTEIGWLESDTELPDIAPEVTSVLAAEILLPRQVHVKYLDPDNNWEPNTQSAIRQITDGVSVELVDVQLAMTADEARATAQRKLYRDYVGGTVHKFTLPWTYLYLYPGYKVIITRAEGFTHTLRLTSIAGSVGLLECEGVALEPSVFTQPANGVFPPGYIPPQAVPAMTVIQLLDTPLLRDGDETNNYGIGFYMAGVPRTASNQNWVGYVLYVNRNGTWTVVGDSNLPATIGKIVSATGLDTTDTSVVDHAGSFTIDLYGTTATLSSITEVEMLADPSKNFALFGDMLAQFGTATQVGGFPNRWTVSVLLNGKRGTGRHVTDTFTDKRFVLIDDAVKFVPMTVADITNNMQFRAVTIGQSLGDAATVEFVWMGGTLKPLAPASIRGIRDADNNILILWNRRSRIGGGLRPFSDVPLGEEVEKYLVEIPDATPPRTMTAITGMSLPAIMLNTAGTTAGTSKNSILRAGPAFTGRTAQVIPASGNFFEAEMGGGVSPGFESSQFGFCAPNGSWDDPDLANSDYDLLVLYTKSFSSPDFISTFFVYERGVLAGTYNYTSTAGYLEKPRIRVLLQSGEFRVYLNWSSPSSVPIHVTGIAPSFPYIVGVHCSGTNDAYLSSATMTIAPQPAIVYSAKQNIEDGLVLTDPVHVSIKQVSAIVGPGEAGEAYVGGYGVAPFAPTDVTGLKLWLKADSLSLSDGDPVGTWNDSSGLGHNATQSTGANKPTYKTSIVNGKPVVRFDGTDDYLSLGDLSASFPSAATLFIVATINSDTDYNLYETRSGADGAWLFTDTNSYFDTFRTSRVGGTAWSVPSTGTHVFALISSASVYEFRLDGGSAQTTSAAYGAGTAHLLGVNAPLSRWFNGDIAEVIVYDSALSTGDRTDVEAYLMDKYGL